MTSGRCRRPLPGWSVQDNVSHIVGTEAMLSGEPGPTIEIDREASEHVRNDIGVFNEQWVEALRGETPDRGARPIPRAHRRTTRDARGDERRRVERRVVHAGRQGHVRSVHADPGVRLLAARTGHPRRGRTARSRDRVSRSRSCSTRWRPRSASSSARRPGRRPGQSVTFALTDGGVVVREMHVEVGERAAVVPALSGPATVVLTMPVGVMTRRCAGRVGTGRTARSGRHRRRPRPRGENSRKPVVHDLT